MTGITTAVPTSPRALPVLTRVLTIEQVPSAPKSGRGGPSASTTFESGAGSGQAGSVLVDGARRRPSRPLVSVVIPTRNRCELLLRALLSVLRQSCRSIEIIIVDDASTEDLSPLIAFIADKPVRLIRSEHHIGASEARNIGMDAALAPHVAFLDSDDYWLSNKLAHQLTLIQAMPEAGVLAGGLAFAKGQRVFKRGYPRLEAGQRVQDYLYLSHGVLQTSTLIMPIEIARKVRFQAALAVHQDTDFLLRASAAGIPLQFDPEVVAIADASPVRSRITTNPENLRSSLAWFEQNSHDWQLATRRSFLRRDYAVRCARAGRRLLGIRYYLAGVWGAGWSLRQELEIIAMLLFGAPLIERLRERLLPLRTYLQGRISAGRVEFESFHADSRKAARLAAVRGSSVAASPVEPVH